MAKRILDLDPIANETIDLSQFLGIDDTNQTFGISLLQLSDFLEARYLERMFPIGSTLYRVDNATPNSLGFPGTWGKVSAGVTLATGKADGTDTGSLAGLANVDVPLLAHTHTASQAAHTHTATTTADQSAHTHSVVLGSHSHGASTTASQTAHSHTVPTASGATREHCSDGCNEGSLVNMATGTTDAQAPGISASTSIAATDLGTVTTSSTDAAISASTSIGSATPPITVGSAGVGGPTINVEGYHLNGVLWMRTA